MPIKGFDSAWYDWTGQDPVTGGFYYVPIMYDVAINKGSQFCILKACDGTNDTRFYAEAMRDARASGILAIPYVWCHGRNWFDPRKQAEFWYSRLKDEKTIAVDFERHLDSVPNYDDLYNAVFRLRELGYKGKLILYTNWGYWLSYGSPDPVWLELFDGGLWLSDPDDDPPNCPSWASASEKLRKAPTPFPDYVIHQYSFLGDPADYGVTTKLAVDENKFMGTIDKFESLFGGATPPPPQEETMELYTVTASALNIRSAPRATEPIVGRLLAGDNVVISEANVSWGKIEQIDRMGVKIALPAPECWCSVNAGYIRKSSLVLSAGGEIKPVIHMTAEGYPENTWTPL